MSPNWVGPSKRMVYKMSQDEGKTYSSQERKVLFGTYFFVAEERRIFSRSAFTYSDLIANAGGFLSILKLVIGLVGKYLNMDALVASIVETLYFTKKGPNRFNKLNMSWSEWILMPCICFTG